MALPREQEQDYAAPPPTEGSLAVDPNRATVQTIPAAEPIPFRSKTEPTEVSNPGRRKFLAALGGVAVGAAVETNPVTRAMVNPLIERILEAIGLKEAPIPTFFDNRADKGQIGTSNIIILSDAEIKQKFPEQIMAKGDNRIFQFPFKPPEGKRASYERSLGLPVLADPNSVPEKDREKQIQAVEEQEEIKRRGIKIQLDFILPKDTTIVAPTNGHVLVERGREDWGEDPNMSPRVRIFSYDENQDVTYVLWFSDTTDGGKRYSFNPLLPTVLTVPDTWRGTSWEKLPSIQRGKDIVKTTIDNQRVVLEIKAYRGKTVGPQVEILDKTLFYVTPNFLTATDDVGREKLIVLQD